MCAVFTGAVFVSAHDAGWYEGNRGYEEGVD